MSRILKINRRKLIAAGASLVAAPAILRHAYAQEVFKIGKVGPVTGPIAGFGEATAWTISQLKDVFAKLPVQVEIIEKDSQSNPNRAAEVATELIEKEGVKLLLAKGTPDTTNPVADQAELNGVPCITDDAPWQPYFFGRGGNPAEGFKWTYHAFWGLEDVIANFVDIWNSSGAAKVVGGLFPNDADGNAWGDPKLGFPAPLAAAGYKLVDPGRYQPLNNDFSSQIAAFKEAGVEIVTGVMIPPDFATFWSQAAQQGFKPKVVTVGKALLFPSSVEALGDRGDGLTTEIWWSPSHPFKSSLTGQTAKELCDAYTAGTGKPWTQPLGFGHALFEMAFDVIKRTKDVNDPESILAALTETQLDTIVGPVSWKGGPNNPVKNVSKTPLVGGQWTKTDKGFDLVITNNPQHPEIPVGGKLRTLG
ncbi:ABC transporter substrate-binding protein [Aestuariivirga sp.]|uniref:ABC transporter substrate-binding protein n=1 Tax=Aestuariivirga sp. TaxID=2650926 RepID=UPI0039E5851A